MLQLGKRRARELIRSLLAAVGLLRARDHALLIKVAEQRVFFPQTDGFLAAEKGRILASKPNDVADLKDQMNLLLGLDHGHSGRDVWSITDADISGFLNEMLRAPQFKKSLFEIYSSNQVGRDEWVKQKAQLVAAGSKVLDVGAGPSPYRNLFVSCEFKTHDFMRYEGYKSGTEGKYGNIDYVSDITAIPVEDGSFDVILCTEVLEHVPDPGAALKEMARITRAGGKLLITAPLGSGLHQRPFHFYGGVTPDWYRHFASLYSLDVLEISTNGGLYKLLAELCTVLASHIDSPGSAHGKYKEIISVLFGAVLPRYLTDLDKRVKFDQYTIGYHVELSKRQ